MRVLRIIISVPGWLYIFACAIGLIPMVVAVVKGVLAAHWFDVVEPVLLWLFWPALLFIHGPLSELPKAVSLSIVALLLASGWWTFVSTCRRWDAERMRVVVSSARQRQLSLSARVLVLPAAVKFGGWLLLAAASAVLVPLVMVGVAFSVAPPGWGLALYWVWCGLSLGVAWYAKKGRGRNPIGWALVALSASPLIAFAVLWALLPLPRRAL
jgi:hypothetical protein